MRVLNLYPTDIRCLSAREKAKEAYATDKNMFQQIRKTAKGYLATGYPITEKV